MPINLDSPLGQVLAGGATVTVSVVTPTAPAEPGHTSYKTWKLQVTNGSQANLNGQPVAAAWSQPTNLIYHKGPSAAAPLPETGWVGMSTIIAGGKATATLNGMPSNPSFLTLGL